MKLGRLRRSLNDVSLAVGATAIGAITLLGSRETALVDRLGPGPALGPTVVAAALITCGVLLLLRGSGPDSDRDPSLSLPAQVAAVLGGLLVAAPAAYALGLSLAAGLLAGWSAVALHRVPLRYAFALAAIVAATTQLVTAALGLPAPILPLFAPVGVIR